MNTPLLLILFPFLLSVFFFFLYPLRQKVTLFTSALVFLFFSAFSYWIPFTAPITLFGVSIPISHIFLFFGRQFAFFESLRTAVVFFYLFQFLFLVVTLPFPQSRFFYVISFCFVGFTTAALFVLPFIYAPFFYLFGSILFILLISFLSPSSIRSTTRFLTFTVLSIPFLFLVGSRLSTISDNIPDASQMSVYLLLLSIGFCLLLALPPFHFWYIDISGSTSPFHIAYLFSFFPFFVVVFLSRFLSEFPWLRALSSTSDILRYGGIFIIVFAGVFVIFQDSFPRLFSCFSYINLGAILFCLSSTSPASNILIYALMAIRFSSYLLWGFSAEILRINHVDGTFSSLQGLMYRYTLPSLGYFLSSLLLIGFPFLVSFPGYWAAFRLISAEYEPITATPYLVLFFLSLISCFFSVFRYIRFSFSRYEFSAGEANPHFGRLATLFILVYIFSIILFGLFPSPVYGLIGLIARSGS